MDLGVFLRRKSTAWAWVVLPVLLVAVLYHSLSIYCDLVEQRLQRKQAILDILPQVERHLSISKDVVLGFSLSGASRGDLSGDAGSRVTELARRHGVMINSLRVEAIPENDDLELHGVDVEMKGEGSLLEIVGFLNELHSPQQLALLHGGMLRMTKLSEEPTYEADLVIRCFGDILQGGGDV